MDLGFFFFHDDGILSLESLWNLNSFFVDGLKGATKLPRLRNVEKFHMTGGSGVTSEEVSMFFQWNICSLKHFCIGESCISSGDLEASFSTQAEMFEGHAMGLDDRRNLALEYVDLSWCENLSADVIGQFITLCPQIKSLILQTTKANSDSIYLLSSIQCSRLMELNLSRCCDIANEVLIWLSRSCKELESLDISWSLVEDEGCKAKSYYSNPVYQVTNYLLTFYTRMIF